MSSASCALLLSILLLFQSPASSEDLRLLARALPGKVKAVAFRTSPDTMYAIAGGSIVSFARMDSFYAQLNLLDLPETPHALTAFRGPDGETLLYAVTEHAFLTIRSAAGILKIEGSTPIDGPYSSRLNPRGVSVIFENQCFVSGGSSMTVLDLAAPYAPVVDTVLANGLHMGGALLLKDSLLFRALGGAYDTMHVEIYRLSSSGISLSGTAFLGATGDIGHVPNWLEQAGGRIFASAPSGPLFEINSAESPHPSVRNWDLGRLEYRITAADNFLLAQTAGSLAAELFDATQHDTLISVGVIPLDRELRAAIAGTTQSALTLITGDNHGVGMYNVSGPTSLNRIASSAPTGGGFSQLDVSENRLFVSGYDSGLLTFDISNPLIPTFVSQIGGRGRSITIGPSAKNVCYMAEGHYTDGGFYTIDASVAASPVVSQYVNVGGGALDFTLHGSVGYLLNTRTDRIYSYALTDPLHPVLVDSIAIPGTPREMIARDSIGYIPFTIVAGKDGLATVSLSDPLHPKLLGSMNLSTLGATSVAFAGPSHLVLLTFDGLVYVIDIVNPESPKVVSSVQGPFHQRHIKTAGSYAISSGKALIRLDDVQQPQVVATYSPPTWDIAEDLVIKDSLVFALFGETGLHILRWDTLTTGIRSSDDEPIPLRLALEQNYPNPFNPETVIRYQVPGLSGQSSVVSVRIYDLLGREVAVLVNEMKPAGRYSVSWDAATMPSGVYYYSLRTEGFQDSRRMILLK